MEIVAKTATAEATVLAANSRPTRTRRARLTTSPDASVIQGAVGSQSHLREETSPRFIPDEPETCVRFVRVQEQTRILGNAWQAVSIRPGRYRGVHHEALRSCKSRLSNTSSGCYAP